MDKAGKTVALETLKGVFGESGAVVVTHYTGLTVAEMTKLRGDLREVGGKLKVVRNRLAKIALKGQNGEAASDMFEGPVAIAYSEDFTAAPKVVVEFAKSNDKLVLLGGALGGELDGSIDGRIDIAGRHSARVRIDIIGEQQVARAGIECGRI